MSEKTCVEKTNKEIDIIYELMDCNPIINLTKGLI